MPLLISFLHYNCVYVLILLSFFLALLVYFPSFFLTSYPSFSLPNYLSALLRFIFLFPISITLFSPFFLYLKLIFQVKYFIFCNYLSFAFLFSFHFPLSQTLSSLFCFPSLSLSLFCLLFVSIFLSEYLSIIRSLFHSFELISIYSLWANFLSAFLYFPFSLLFTLNSLPPFITVFFSHYLSLTINQALRSLPPLARITYTHHCALSESANG